MNILRLLGQAGLYGKDAPVRHEAKRRGIKTVMQELIYRAGGLIEHGRRRVLGLGANDRSAQAFARLHGDLFAACGQAQPPPDHLSVPSARQARFTRRRGVRQRSTPPPQSTTSPRDRQPPTLQHRAFDSYAETQRLSDR